MTFDPNNPTPPAQPQYPPPTGGYPAGAYPAQPAHQPEQVPAAPASDKPAAGLDAKGHVRTTRFSALWVGLIIAAILLIALLIFIAQNSQDVSIKYLGAHGRVPLAVALLLSAIAGLLLIAVPGTARILQLRRALRKNARR
jgi:uncharacterized integral membrane protein